MIEVMIALSILSIGLLALSHLQATSIRNEIIAQQTTQALHFGQSILDDLRHYTDLTNGNDSYAAIASGNQTLNGLTANYTATWSVTEFTSPDYKSVDLTVVWSGPDGDNYNTQLSTRIGRLDPYLAGSLQQTSQAGAITPP